MRQGVRVIPCLRLIKTMTRHMAARSVSTIGRAAFHLHCSREDTSMMNTIRRRMERQE